MTQDEIRELFRQVGLGMLLTAHNVDACVNQFAKLVAEKEREACWKIACEYTQKYTSMACLAAADAIRARGQE
jgi:N-acetylglutamate synthase-like GNAT family acetyltransferase